MASTKIRGNTQILDATVTNTQIALPDAANPQGILLTKIQDGSLLIKSNGSVPFTAPIGGVAPVAAGDLATKNYVDQVAQGLDVKASVRALAATNIVLSATQSVDGVSLAVGDRVLVTGQTTASQNGIYNVAVGAWTRSSDAASNQSVTSGLFTFVEEGTNYTGSGWVLTTANPIVLGTTALAFAQFSSAGLIMAGAGLTKTGNTLNVVSSNGAIVATPGAIALTLADSTLQITASGLKLATLAQGKILIGDATGTAQAQTVSGDITISASGVATISTGAVNNSKISVGSIGLDKLVSGTAGQLIITNASGVPTYTPLGGDATISAAGVLTIGNLAITTAKIADAAVTLAKLALIPTGNFIVGTSTGNASVAITGDVSIAPTGVATINAATVVRVADVITRETPAGVQDGTNTTFTLANTPRVGTEHVYYNGLLMDTGASNDYTITGAIITLTFAPLATDKIRVSYRK